jgi:hypothetical protein
MLLRSIETISGSRLGDRPSHVQSHIVQGTTGTIRIPLQRPVEVTGKMPETITSECGHLAPPKLTDAGVGSTRPSTVSAKACSIYMEKTKEKREYVLTTTFAERQILHTRL